jgi:transcriptional regulator with XRE-family HTH domain
MEFGEKIKALRLERGMTLEQVGNLVGVGKSTVRKWESGQIANMRRDKIALLAQALGVTPGYLMGWDSSLFIGEGGLEKSLSEATKIAEQAGDAQQAREDLANDPDRKALLNLARYGSTQDVKQVAALIDALRATNPDFYDGDDPA